MIDYREIKFEEAIEDHLTHHGYTKAESRNFDRALALDPTVLLPFIRETQSDKWKIIADYHGKNAEAVFLEEAASPTTIRAWKNSMPISASWMKNWATPTRTTPSIWIKTCV